MPGFFSDGVVLQRERAIAVWGTAPTGANVTVTLGENSQTTQAGDNGRWRVDLKPVPAGGPHILRVAENSQPVIEIRDVQIGEVWIASGQSNMHWTFSHNIRDKERELAAAGDPLLRQFTVQKAQAFVRKGQVNEPQFNAIGQWRGASRAELLADGEDGASALAYFFGRRLRQELRVPVGIYNASVGGSAIEAWSPGGSLFNKMIHPLAPGAIRGVIWYQGEANINAAGEGYVDQTQRLVAAWRALWQQGDFPFYYVQLAPFIHSTRPNSKAPTHALPGLWEAQTAVMSAVPNSGMVVITDLVESTTDIHPPNKQDVGVRLANWALSHDYGRTDVVYSGPMYREIVMEGKAIRVRFDHAHGGLASRDGKPLIHFQIAGQDRKFMPAQASLDGDSVLVQHPDVPQPVAVRFAWDELAMPNLMNHAGLPANSFRTDAWPLGNER